MKPLKPVMSALLAASSAAYAPGISYANGPFAPVKPSGPLTVETPTAESVTASAAVGDDNPINLLSKIVAENPAARKDIGERLARFVQGTNPKERTYLTPELLADKAVLPSVVAVAKDWPETNKDKPGMVAVLYFVIGPDGDLPAWAQGPVLSKTLVPGMKWNRRLQAALATADRRDPLTIAGQDAANQTVRYLNEAATWAQKVFDDPRTRKDILASIKDNATTAPVVVVTGGTSTTDRSNDPTGSGFDFKALYQTGAKVWDVYGPNDGGKFRTLSMKVYSSRDATTGQIVNSIGIVDITAGDVTSPSLPQFVKFAPTGDKGAPVVFRDGGRKYTINIGTDGTISLTRPDAKAGDPGTMSTSFSDLTVRRNTQIASSGIVDIGGQPYHVIGQGGATGSVMFFPANADGDANSGGAHPVLMGTVTMVRSDGSTIPVPPNADGSAPKPDLGTLNGDGWHLKFVPGTQLWTVEKGPGDVIPTTPAPPTTSTSTTTAPPPGTPKALADAIALATADKDNKAQVWVVDGGNKGFSADALTKIRIMSNKQGSIKHFLVLLAPGTGVKGNQFEFSTDGAARLLSMRGVKGYVALGFTTDAQYYTLANFFHYLQHAGETGSTTEMSGAFLGKKMKDVKDIDIAVDILVHHLKVPAGDPMLTTIAERVTKNAKGSEYLLSGDDKVVVLDVGDVKTTIWPEEKVSGAANENATMTGLRGPGTAVNLIGSVGTAFPKEMEVTTGHPAKLLKEGDHIALYSGSETENGDETAVAVWYVMIGYTQNGQDSRSKPLPVFGGKDRLTLPASYEMKGLGGADLPSSTQLMLLHGSTQEKGAIAAYRYVLPDAQGGSNAKSRQNNCAGPLIWWGGLTAAQVQSACESDSKVP